MKMRIRRIAASLLAFVMVFTLLPAFRLIDRAEAAAVGDIYSDSDTRVVGTLNQGATIALPINVRDYDNDGMLFEYAEYMASGTGTRTVAVDSTIAAPVTATGYNAEQGESFAGPAANATVSYGTNDGRYYHFVHGDGDGTASAQYGAGLGARFRINFNANRYKASATQYVAIRYRVASTSANPTDGNSTLTASILGSTVQYSSGSFNEIVPDKCVRSDFDLNSDGQWHEVIVNMADFVSYTPYYSSPPYYTSWASTLNFYSYYFALEYNENLGEVVDVAYVAFFPTKAQAQAYINQCDCYREDVETIEYTVPAGTPEAPIGVDVRGDASFDGYGSSVDNGVSYYFTDDGGRFWGVSDTKKGGYGVGFKALLLKNVYSRFGATMDDIRYVAIRYRASSTGYEDGAQIPLYLFAENQSLGYYSKDDFMEHDGVPYFSNRLSTFTRFYATNDGQWQTAVVDFADYVSQYPTGEGYYYQPYHGTDLVGRIGIADERALMYNDIDISYIAFFSDKADAQAYNDQYAAYLNGTLEATTATYTAQMTDTTETWNYYFGNNRAFGLLVNSGYMTSGRGNYYTSASIGNTYSDINMTSTSYTNLSRYNSNLHGTYNGNFTIGLTKDELVNGMLTYKDETVAYLAELLKTTLAVPETFVYGSTTYHSYNYVQGRPDGEKFGYFDTAQTEPRDYAGYLRYALGMTEADGTDKLSGTTVAARADSIDNLGSLADTMAKVAAGTLSLNWNLAKDQIETCYDAAYFMLNSLFYDGGIGNKVPEYKYLQMTQETANGETYYVFDGGYTNVLYDYGDGIISNSGSEDSESVGAIKPYFWYSTSATTTLYPFLPILEEMGDSYTHTDSPYYKDDGVQTTTEGKNSYVKRDFNYALDGHAKFVYNADDEQYFKFEGDDDVYLYINGQLVMDLGGAHGIAREKIYLNDYAAQIGLEDGGVYSFDFYYMERHGYGANMRIETNIQIYNDNIEVQKSATQNGTEIENNGIIDKTQGIEYTVRMTNKSKVTQHELFINDEAINFYIGYDMDTEGSPLGSFEDAGGNTVTRAVTDLTLTVENPKYETRTFRPQSLQELKTWLVSLDATGDKETGLGFRPGDTLTVSGIRYFILGSDWTGSTGDFEGMFTNTVYVRAGVDPGIGSFSVVGTGNPVYYMWKGHPLTVPVSDLMSGYTGSYNAAALTRCTIGGTPLANTNALTVNAQAGTVTFNYSNTGTQQCYFSTGSDVLAHVTVYVYDTADSTFVLDYGLSADLTDDLTENDVLSIAGVDTDTVWEAFTATAPTYNPAANRVESIDWDLPSSGGKSFIPGKTKQTSETTEVTVPYAKPAASYNAGYVIIDGAHFANSSTVYGNNYNACSYVTPAAPECPYLKIESGTTTGYGFGFRLLLWRNTTAVAKNNIRYAAIRYRVNTDADGNGLAIHVGAATATGSTNSSTPTVGGGVGNLVAAKKLADTSAGWHTLVIDLSADGESYYNNGALTNQFRSYSAISTVNELWLGLDAGQADKVDIGYVCFFGSQAEAEAYNTAYTHYLNGETYTDVQTVTTDLTPDEGTAIGYSIADGKYFNDNSSTASGTAIMNGTLSYAAESTNNPAYAEVISSANSGDTGYGFGARALVWADNTNGISGSRLQVIAVRYRVADYVGGDCDLGIIATRTKSSGTTIETAIAPAAARFAANTDGEWHTEYVLMGQSPYAQSSYAKYSGGTANYSTFDTGYTYYQLFAAQQWMAENKIDYAYVLGFDSLAAAQAYDAAFDSFYYQQNPATGTTVGTVNPTGLSGSYGTYAGSLEDATLRFTPDMFMNGPSDIYLTLRVCDSEFDGSDKMSDINIHHEVEMFQKITTVPASVVYYEDDFPAINYATENTQATITPGTASTGMQGADQQEAYGHDSTYEAGGLEASAGSDTTITAIGGKVFSFDFTGTGFEIVSRVEAAASATLDVRVYDAGGELVYNFPVITEYDNGGDDVGGETMYQVPVISYNDLDYGDYTVEVWVVSAQNYDDWTISYDTVNGWIYYTDGTDYWKSVFNSETLETEYAKFLSTYTPGTAYTGAFGTASATSPAAKQSTLHVDGVRIFNPLSAESQAQYYNPDEANATFTDVRDLIAEGKMAFAELNGGTLKLGTDVFTFVENRNNVLSDGETELSGNAVSGVTDYLYLGPNNEVYLDSTDTTQGIAFYVKPIAGVPEASRTLQIGAHRIDESAAIGASASGVNLNCGNSVLVSGMTSGTEQYYRIDPTKGIYDEERGYLVFISAENGLVSLSSLKYKGYTVTAFADAFASGGIDPWWLAPENSDTPEEKTLRRMLSQLALLLPADSISGEAEQVRIKSAYLKLSEDIHVLYAAEIPEGFENPYMVFTYQGEAFTVSDYAEENGLYVFDFGEVTPQCMGDNISATLYAEKNGETASDTVERYSIRTYCVNQLTRYKDDAKLVTLLSDLLVYGAEAQKYEDYRTDELVTNGLTLSPTQGTTVPESNASFAGEASELADWTGATLILGSRLSVRFTFAAEDVDDLTVYITVGGRTQEYTEEDFTACGADRYTVDFNNILATEFDDGITASFSVSGKTVGRSVTYSVNTYLYSKQNSPDVGDLVQALYNYGAAAKAYAAD